MASRRDGVLLALGAFVLSGAGFYLGTGLQPWAFLTWLAPLPVLLAAPRVPGRLAAAAAGGAWLVGQLNEWTYLTRTLDRPVVVVAGLFLASALLFAYVVRVARTLMINQRWVAAALVLPAAWVGAELLVSLISPDGAFWSLAYTQSGVRPVVQVASLTGYWGVTFLVLAVPSAVAVALAPGAPRMDKLRLGAGAAALLVVALAFGFVRMGVAGPDGRVQRVVLISANAEAGTLDVSTEAGGKLLDGYVEQVHKAVAGGARIVVLPEAVFSADTTAMATMMRRFVVVAREGGATVVVGVIQKGDPSYNTAQVVTANGTVASYRKRHLLSDDTYEPGEAAVILPVSRWGVAIGKDLDFPPLARENRRLGAGLMLVPAWDFTDDAWLRSRMAIMRGVENGVPLIRSARSGALTVSDGRGKVLTEVRAAGADGFTTTVTDLTVGANGTLYTKLGPWFGWLSVIGVVWLAIVYFRVARPRP